LDINFKEFYMPRVDAKAGNNTPVQDNPAE
jgi:hypothetical protein